MKDDNLNKDRIPSAKEALGVVFFTFVFSAVISLIHSHWFEMEGKLVETKEFQLAEMFVFIPLLIYLYIRKYPLQETLRLKMIPSRVAGYSLLIGLSATLLIAELDYLVSLIFPVPSYLRDAIEGLMTAQSVSDVLIIFISAVLLAGLLEELLFRGFLQRALEHSRMDITQAVFFTALMFSLFHIPWWYIQTTVFGVILGVMAWKSQSVLPAVIVHAVNNALNLILINVEPEQYAWLEWKGHVSPPILIVAGLGIYWGFRQLYRHYDREAARSLPQANYDRENINAD